MDHPKASAKTPHVVVAGCGYVGVTTAAILANSGYAVTAVETDARRLKTLRNGASFFFEAGVDALLRHAIDAGTLTFSRTLDKPAAEAGYVFSCVGTPDNSDGSSNLAYVDQVAATAAQYMQPRAIFIQKSTVPVGTGQRLQKLFAPRDIRYVSNPEFLREASAIRDSLWFDRAVAGADDPQAADEVLGVYNRITQTRAAVAEIAGIMPPATVPAARFMPTGLASAELIKVSANAFLALKISFANSIAKLADASGGDIQEVMAAVGADPRIGSQFLNAGRGYGGGCFPKDVSGLIRSAADLGVPMEIMEAASQVNDSMAHYILQKASSTMNTDFEGVPVAVLGLSFKAGTSDVRRSPAIEIANTLAERGAAVSAFDPVAHAEARALLHDAIQLAASAAEACRQAHVIFLATDWPEFLEHFEDIIQGSAAELVVDCMNCLDALKPLSGRTVAFLGVGRGQLIQ